MTPLIKDSGWFRTQEGRCYSVGTRTVKFDKEVIAEYIGCWARKELALTYGQERSFKVARLEDGVKVTMRYAIDSGD
jgi:hypothetical protein